MSEENSGANNFIWAFALVLIVAIIAAAIFYSGGLGGAKKHEIDIKVDAPAAR
jgi:hypothetical protein